MRGDGVVRDHDAALAAVRERLEHTAAEQNPQWVLGAGAIADAGELAAAAGAARDDQADSLLGNFYWFRFEASHSQTDVATAALFFAPVFASDPGNVPKQLRRLFGRPPGPVGSTDPSASATRAQDLFLGYEHSGALPSLWESTVLFRAAVTAASFGGSEWAGYVSGLGGALLRLAERSADADLLEQAVRVHRAAASAAPAGDRDRASVLANFGAALERLAERTGKAAAATEAARTCRDAMAAALTTGPVRALCLTNLGNALRLVASHSGDILTLQEAVACHREAVNSTPPADRYRSGRLSALGASLESLSERTGSAAALWEAVDVIRAAVAMLPDGHRARGGYQSDLGAALQRLFESTMDMTALTEAVQAHRDAVAATAVNDGDRPRRLSNLGAALRALGERVQDAGLLGEAVDAQLDAVTAAPTGHRDRAGYLSNLGNALLTLSERTADAQALQDAVDMQQAAVDSTPAGHPDHAACLSQLTSTLLVQARRARDDGERRRVLDEAVTAGRAGVAASPAGHPARAMSLDNLGNALGWLARETGQPGLLENAGRCLTEAAADVNAAPAVRISAYQGIARLPGQAGLSAVEALAAMETAAALLTQVAPRSLTRADRQHSLSRMASIAGLAAAAAVAAGQPGRAIELLEQTRGILAADSLAARDRDLPRLRAVAPGLAVELEELRARITVLTAPSRSPRAAPPRVGPDAIQARRDAQTDWHDLLARIRAVEGLQDFLRAPDVRQLARHALEGPVILPYTTPSRCDALVLTNDPGAPVRAVPLPALTEDEAARQADRLLRARLAALDEEGTLRTRAVAHHEILGILGWMWDAITDPVLASLGYTAEPVGEPWPRVWWCPVGILGYLPLHAAGHHQTGDVEQARTVLDRVISSYTPTIRSLGSARAQRPAAAATATLIVAAPSVPGARPLAGVADEAELLASLIPGARILQDPDPAAVLADLPTHPVVHFACHGHADWSDPSASMLALPGDHATSLTAADISALQLNGTLAYLSACDTSVTSPALADEGIHITGAFHLAGYPCVIGTLWPADDDTARDLACDIYRELTDGGATPPDARAAAHALHRATCRLRSHRPDKPGLWAAHTHTGV
jgi:tetratricopeptide (TPR) repeat protein